MSTLAERFWSKVDRSGGPDACWPWTGALNHYGYGHFWMNGKIVRSPRLAVVLGSPDGTVPPRPLADGEIVRHSRRCHESGVGKQCSHPGHLIPGNHSQNLTDAYDYGERRKRPRWLKEPLALDVPKVAT